jgi:hypothetical protein
MGHIALLKNQERKKITSQKKKNNPSREKKKKKKKNVIMHVGNPAFFTLEYHCSPPPPFLVAPRLSSLHTPN